MLLLLSEPIDTCPDCAKRLEPIAGWLICLNCGFIRVDPFDESDISTTY